MESGHFGALDINRIGDIKTGFKGTVCVLNCFSTVQWPPFVVTVINLWITLHHRTRISC